MFGFLKKEGTKEVDLIHGSVIKYSGRTMNISLAVANFRLFSMCDLLIVIFAKSNFLHYKILQNKINYSILQHVLSH